VNIINLVKYLLIFILDASFLKEYGIRGFPTIKVFVPGKPPVDYQGARDVKPIVEFALSQVC
jgi:protein disulfide-isomerase A6